MSRQDREDRRHQETEDTQPSAGKDFNDEEVPEDATPAEGSKSRPAMSTDRPAEPLSGKSGYVVATENSFVSAERTPKSIMKTSGVREDQSERVKPFTVRFSIEEPTDRRRRAARRIGFLENCKKLWESPQFKLVMCILFGVMLPCTLVYLGILFWSDSPEKKDAVQR